MSENYLPAVVSAAVVGDHILRLLFSDGMVGDVDFSAKRWTGSSRLRQPGTAAVSRARRYAQAQGIARHCALRPVRIADRKLAE